MVDTHNHNGHPRLRDAMLHRGIGQILELFFMMEIFAHE